MASVALTIAGGILGGPIGAGVGAALGTWLDRAYILPALFPAARIEGPRVGELRLQQQEEGSAANWALGANNPLAGTIIWLGPLIEVKDTDEVGGKGGGGGGQKVTTYTYYVDLAIAFARELSGSIPKIFAEGELLYDLNADVSIASNQLTVSVLGTNPAKMRMKISTPSGGPDLSRLHSGLSVTAAGFSNPANNGSWKCTAAVKNSDGSSYCILKNTTAVAEAAGAAATLFQDVPEFDTSVVAGLTFHLGSGTQNPDPLIEGYEGTGNVPGFRGTTYVVFNRLNITRFGNRIPQIKVILDAGQGGTIATAIAAILGRAGRASTDYDVTGLSGTVEGYAVAGPNASVQVLQPPMVAHDVLVQEGNAKLRFFHRKDATIIDVPAQFLGAHEFRGEQSRPIQVKDAPDVKLPAQVHVKYLDKEFNGQNGDQSYRTRDFVTDGELNIDLASYVSTAPKMQALARRVLWAAWANRQPVSLTLPPRYWYVQESDLLRFTVMGRDWLLLVLRVDWGHNGIIAIEAVVEQQAVLVQTEEGESPTESPGSVYVPPDVNGAVIQAPPITGGGTGFGLPHDIVVLSAVANSDPIAPWRGTTLWLSPDDDDYTQVDVESTEATMGRATTVLAAGAVGLWDNVHTVDVELDNGSLESRSEDDVLNGANRAVIGDEIVGFRDATLIATNTYRLAGLLRALQDTVDEMATHAADERFVLLTGGGIREIHMSLANLNVERSFRFVPAGGLIDNAETDTQTITGRNLRPFAPTNIEGFYDGSGNLTIRWLPRTRAVVRLFSGGTLPLLESEERFEIDIRTDPAFDPVRTISVTASHETTYSAADQSDDGFAAGDPIYATVYQLSDVVGRGRGEAATL